MILLGDSYLIFHSESKVSFISLAKTAVAYDDNVVMKIFCSHGSAALDGDVCWSMVIQVVVLLVCMRGDIGAVGFSLAAWLAIERSGRCVYYCSSDEG